MNITGTLCVFVARVVPGTVVIEWAQSVSWLDGVKGVPEPWLVWFH